MWLDYVQIWYLGTGNPPSIFHKTDVITRYFYDDLYMIIIPILMANIIYGLILDNFSVLKQNEDESRADSENKCFICGKAKEDIERLTSKSFLFHIQNEHCEWNYIFFMAYLEFKERTEYSGIESYIQAHIDLGEVDWIPQQQGLSFKEEQEEEENQNLVQIKEINEALRVVEQDIKKFKKAGRQV